MFLGGLIILANLVLFLFLQIPTYSRQIDLSDFFQNQQNYLTISINDDIKTLKQQGATIIIRHWDSQTITIPLRDEQLASKKYTILSQDKISFVAKSKNLKSWANIYLWDGTIIRVLPKTTITLAEIFKNLKNPLLSKNHITLQEGNIWFASIKTIVKDDAFNIKTNDGTIIIRGTAGLVAKTLSGTIVYPHDHYVEVKNQAGKKLVAPWEIIEFGKDFFKKIDIQQLKALVWEQIEQLIKLLPSLDKQDIQQYKQSLQSFVQQYFGTEWEQTKQLKTLAKLKMKLLAWINPEKYQQTLKNYYQYQLITNSIDNLDTKQININANLLLIPINDALQKLKLDYLQQQAQKSKEVLQTYIINQANYLQSQGLTDQAKQILNKIGF